MSLVDPSELGEEELEALLRRAGAREKEALAQLHEAMPAESA
ncbi:MAG TPA: hypothetical protein VFH50_02300 [Acidimicrobiales bacterium]|nr:hypothetical protein [Acidimicrobiales bacterium]